MSLKGVLRPKKLGDDLMYPIASASGNGVKIGIDSIRFQSNCRLLQDFGSYGLAHHYISLGQKMFVIPGTEDGVIRAHVQQLSGAASISELAFIPNIIASLSKLKKPLRRSRIRFSDKFHSFRPRFLP